MDITAFKDLSGGLFGALIASAAAATAPAAPSFGPHYVVLLGYDLALLPALFGAIGVIATRRFAPLAVVEARMTTGARHALTAMMVLGMIALVMAGEQRPLVIVGIAGGLGYSGVAIFELLAAGIIRAVRFTVTAWTRGAASILKDKTDAD